MRILLVEDERQLRESLGRGLREDGHDVDLAGDGDQGLAHEAASTYDVIVLDLLLPGVDGIEVCRRIRARGTETPILMLTARDGLDDKVVGLDAGADDYLTKPFAFRELQARLRALTRRRGGPQPERLVVGDLVLDTGRNSAKRRDREIPLTLKEYGFLEYLMRNAGRIVTREEISQHVWDESLSPFSNLVHVYASKVRTKVDRGERVRLFTTHRGLGYMIAPPSVAIAPAPHRTPDSSPAVSGERLTREK